MTQQSPHKRRRSRPVRLSSSTKLILLIAGLLALIFFLQGGLSLHHSSRKNADTINQNIATLSSLQAAEAPNFEAMAAEAEADAIAQAKADLIAAGGLHVSDLSAEQSAILAMDTSESSADEINGWFKNAALIGDSISEAVSGYEWLDDSRVFAKIGISVSTSEEQVQAAIAAKPSVIFMAFGLNDLEGYGSNVSAFTDAYTIKIDEIRQALPNTMIYINGVFPVASNASTASLFASYRDTYNAALDDLCKGYQSQGDCVFFIDSSFVLQQMPELYDKDGIHPKSKFYPMWLTYLADIAGLSNDTDSIESTDTTESTESTQPAESTAPAEN